MKCFSSRAVSPGTSHWTAIEEVEPASDLKVVEYSAPKVNTSDQPTNMLPFMTLPRCKSDSGSDLVSLNSTWMIQRLRSLCLCEKWPITRGQVQPLVSAPKLKLGQRELLSSLYMSIILCFSMFFFFLTAAFTSSMCTRTYLMQWASLSMDLKQVSRVLGMS